MPRTNILQNIFNGLLLFSLLFIVYTLYFSKNSKNATVYVDNNKLFNEFRMTKELKKEGEKELSEVKKQIDSISIKLNLVSSENEKSNLIQEIINRRQYIEEFQLHFTQTNSDKIWSRIESYAKDYAEKNNIELIIGKQFKGDVIYGSKKIDETDMLLTYINKKYEGL